MNRSAAVSLNVTRKTRKESMPDLTMLCNERLQGKLLEIVSDFGQGTIESLQLRKIGQHDRVHASIERRPSTVGDLPLLRQLRGGAPGSRLLNNLIPKERREKKVHKRQKSREKVEVPNKK
jgi:hypothetical protein